MRRRNSRPEARPAPLDAALGWLIVGLALLPLLAGRPRRGPAYDFGVYRAAGSSVIHHLGLYGPDFLVRAAFHDGFTYPPFAALLFAPFALVPRGLAFAVWFVACLLMLRGIVRISFPSIQRRLHVLLLTAAAALTVPVAEHLSLGQVGIPLTLLCLADIARRGRLPRGVLVGLATAIKLTPGIFIVHFALTRQWRALRNSIGTVAGCWLLAFVVLHSDSIRYFGGGLFLDNRRAGSVYEVANQSLWGLTHRWLGSSADAVWIGCVLIVGIAGLLIARRLSHDPVAAATTLGITALLVSPVSWMHGGIWLIPAVGILWRRKRRLTGLAVFGLSLTLSPHPPATHVLPLRLWHESLVAIYLWLLASIAQMDFRNPLRERPTTERPGWDDPANNQGLGRT